MLNAAPEFNILTYSHLESDRFGFKVFRGVSENVDGQRIFAEIISNEADIAMVRFPCSKQYDITRLDEIGVPYIVADTLMYYHCDLKKHGVKEIKNKELKFIQCKAEHVDILDNLVEATFTGYTNHYNSNVYLPSKENLKGYQEWARNYLADNNPGRFCWLVQRNDKFIGFATCGMHDDIYDAVLFSVLPEESGGGVYADMHRYTQRYFLEKGCTKAITSTQAQNYAVQKVLPREGFFLASAYNTIHFNSMLTATTIEKVVLSMTSSCFDNNFRSTIVSNHNRIWGSTTTVLKRTERFVKKISFGNYKTTITYPYNDKATGKVMAVIQVHNINNELCYLAYEYLRY